MLTRIIVRALIWAGRSPSRRTVAVGVFGGLQIVLAILGFAVITLVVPPVLKWASGSIHRSSLVTAGMVAAGIALFTLRARSRFIYGAVEASFAVAGFGMSIALSSSAAINADRAVALMLGACYVLVRGIDNVVTGYKDVRALGTAARSLADWAGGALEATEAAVNARVAASCAAERKLREKIAERRSATQPLWAQLSELPSDDPTTHDMRRELEDIDRTTDEAVATLEELVALHGQIASDGNRVLQIIAEVKVRWLGR